MEKKITQENFEETYVDSIELERIDKFVCDEMARQIHRYIKAMKGSKTIMLKFEEQLATLTVEEKEEAIARYIDLNRKVLSGLDFKVVLARAMANYCDTFAYLIELVNNKRKMVFYLNRIRDKYEQYHEVFEENGHFGIKDHKGNVLIPAHYDFLRTPYVYVDDLRTLPVIAQRDGKMGLILPDGKVWFFTRCDIYIKNRRYVQLSAADVTEQWMLTNELNAQRAMLQSRGLELKEMISEVRFLCREEEMLRIRSRFHDILGQRLALLFRSLREGEEPDEELIRRFAYNLPEELSGREAVTTAADRLETLCRLMQEIGVTLIIDGNLPAKESLAWLGMDIITEAVTNSVRHGLASEVYISLGQSGGNFSMRITDNGIPPKSEPVEGGGLSSIRRKVGLFDGSVRVETKPRFVLSVFIPGGETL